MNKADSERLESALGQMGLSSVSSPDDADVIFLNSCVVRQSAEDKVVGTLGSLKPLKINNPEKIVALMGCMVGPKTDVLEQRFPYVDVFLRPQQYEPLINLIGYRLGIDPEGCVGTLTASPDVTAYIPIIHGCDKFCTFCIIPYRRGREISRPISEIVRETELLSHRGVKEVTLLGQNVDSYGHDLPGKPDLGDLLSEVNEVPFIQRVRFLTSHPNDMSDHIIDKVAELEKVCEHINLPFQAGDDQVLSDMRRGYTSDDYIKLVEKIRNRIPSVSMSTDLIVGFCGESYSQFEKTLDMLREIRFDKVHSAAYSTRVGTIADRKMKDDVSDEDKRYRLGAVDELQKQIQTELNSSYVDVETQVLIEGVKRERVYGRNRNDKLVYVDASEDLIGDMASVTIKETGPWSLKGNLS
jgi:tRNA-2-methylthio-N6-dimethylallyladenosine synthase